MIKKLIEKLDHLDPMPWHQAVLMGVGLFILIVMALLAPN